MENSLKEMFEDRMRRFAKTCMCIDCCYWRTIANTITICAYIVGQDPMKDGWFEIKNPDDIIAHKNGQRLF